MLRSSGTTITMADTPPSSPVAGQLWWETDTGRLFIYFNDGNSSQWVQVNGTGPLNTTPDAPSDGNEYVRVNGVWRLKRQVFTPTGGSLNVPVPSGAKMAKLNGVSFVGATGNGVALRLSIDGTTFAAATGDYSVMGQIQYGGTAATAKTAMTGTIQFNLTPTGNNLTVPATFEAQVVLIKPSTAHGFTYQTRGIAYDSNALYLLQEIIWSGYTATTALNNGIQIQALQFLATIGAWVAGTVFCVEWVY